jgi:transposase
MPLGKPRRMLADKGRDGDAVRRSLLPKGVTPVIPPRANRRTPARCDFRRYRDRKRIGRMFNRLKQARRIAARDDKAAQSLHSLPQPRRITHTAEGIPQQVLVCSSIAALERDVPASFRRVQSWWRNASTISAIAADIWRRLG